MNPTTIPIRDRGGCARYQMPIIQVRHKNKGQFNSSEISGVNDVAKALRVDQKSLIKWFSLDLHTQIARQEKLLLVLKGIFTYEDILYSLRKFIAKYVICPICDLPELNYCVKKNTMHLKCRACPFTQKVSELDRIWKLIHQSELINPNFEFSTKK